MFPTPFGIFFRRTPLDLYIFTKPGYSAGNHRPWWTTREGWMQYSKPELRSLGSLAALTLGQNGSCPDGGGHNNTQLGGMSTCGVSGEASG